MKRVVPYVMAIGAIVAFWLFMHRKHETPDNKPVGTPVHAVPSADPPRPGKEPARISVTVTDAKGPIDKAVVRAVEQRGDIVTGTTNADGIAHLDVTPGAWTTSASAPAHLTAVAPEKKVAANETITLALTLAAGGVALTGQVTDASGGPVQGARVDAAPIGTRAKRGDAVAAAFTGADGKYTLTVPTGEAVVAVNHPDYAAQQRYVEIGEAGAVANFQLVPGAVIEGVVQDQASHATVGGANVVAHLEGVAALGEQSRKLATAGPDGKFRLTGLRPGAYALEASTADRPSASPTQVGVGVAEQISDVVLFVGKGVSVSGIVVDEADHPVGGATVTSNHDRDTNVISKPDGTFTIVGLAPGRYELTAESTTHLWLASTRVDVALKDITGVKITVATAKHFKGHVEPREVCDITVAAPDHTRHYDVADLATSTAADGAFDIGPIRALAYQLIAHCANGDEGEATAIADGETVIQVKPGGVIAGRVVDQNGKPLAGAMINGGFGGNTEITNGMVTSGATAITSDKGEFELTGLAAATYHLRVLAHAKPVPMKTKTAASVTINGGEHKSGVELVVDRPDGVIKGTVTGPDGAAIADAWVSVDQSFEDELEMLLADQPENKKSVSISSNGDDLQAVAPVLTDAQGHYEIHDLPRVKWTVTAEAQAGKLRGHGKVTPDATADIKVTGVQGLTGTVHATGTPPQTFTVSLEGASTTTRTFAWPDKGDATFSFPRLDPGDYQVTVSSTAGGATAKVSVGTDPAHVDLTLATAAHVKGILVDKATHKPLPQMGVALVPDKGDGSLSIMINGEPEATGADGSFDLTTRAGNFVLVALAPNLGQSPAVGHAKVTEAATVDLGTIEVELKQ
ncbi:MAG: carboxypeptidase-like regulatory domain-containing protein [Kofleriaceae bacterium]